MPLMTTPCICLLKNSLWLHSELRIAGSHFCHYSNRVLRQYFEQGYWTNTGPWEMAHVTIIYLNMEKARSRFNVSFIKVSHKIHAYSIYPRNMEESADLFRSLTCYRSETSPRSSSLRHITSFYSLTRQN